MQKQHEADSVALVAAMGKVRHFRMQLTAAAHVDHNQEVAEATVDELRTKLTEEHKQQHEAYSAALVGAMGEVHRLRV